LRKRIKTLLITLVAVAMIIFPHIKVAADGATSWTEAQGVSSRQMRAITAGNGMFVQVGGDGRIETSADGRNWTMRESHTNAWLRRVIWTGNMFLVTGEKATILTSEDGINWTKEKRFSPADIEFTAVGWNGEYFVAMSNLFGGLYTSTDGKTWDFHKRYFEDKESHGFQQILWDGNRFVAFTGYYKRGIYTSKDGLEWNLVEQKNKEELGVISSIAYNGELYVRVAPSEEAVYVSKDLSNWTLVKIDGYYLTNIRYVGGKFIAVGENYQLDSKKKGRGNVWTSEDGYKWTRVSNKTLNSTSDAAFNGTVYAVTTYPMSEPRAESYGATLISKNGLSWEEIRMGSTEAMNSVATNGSSIIAVNSYGFAMFSEDGVKWKRISISDYVLHKILWDGERYIAVGSRMYTSKDGLSWTPLKASFDGTRLDKGSRQRMLKNGKLFCRISDLQWNGKQYVAVGEWGLVMTSTDLKKWTMRKSGVIKWIDKVAWNGKRYVASTNDDEAKTLVSENGFDWKVVDLTAKHFYSYGVATDGDRFVMIGVESIGEIDQKGTFVNTYKCKSLIFTSTDGVRWEKTDLNHYEGYHSISWTGKEFLISSPTVILTSGDGVSWKNIAPEVYHIVEANDGIRYKGRLVTVGINSSILWLNEDGF